MRQTLLVVLLVAAGASAAVGPDILVRGGTIVATATDYQMDGTMWAAFTVLEDSNVFIYRSTDHGLSWQYRSALAAWGQPMDRIELVVGEGDSAFNYLFYLRNDNNGDLWVARRDVASDSFWNFPVFVGPDTISDFTVCRDHTGSNYWLYAMTLNEQDPGSVRALCAMRSTTYGREWVPLGSGPSSYRDLRLSAGAGSYLYLAAREGDTLVRLVYTLYLSPGYWVGTWTPMNDDIREPVMAPSFTLPESTATVWCLWSQNYQNSGDWDVKYSCSTDGGSTWSEPAYLAGSAAYDECFPDLRNYTSAGNQYVNASYISDDNQYRTVYRRYANAANPAQWSDTLRINEGSAGTGSRIRPRLCYTPGGPFTGAGCVFVGAGLDGCWWNAPYPVSVADGGKSSAARRDLLVKPSIGRGPFRITTGALVGRVGVFDGGGRLVRSLMAPGATWDGNDAAGRRLASGVYLVRFEAGEYHATQKLVLQR